MTAAQGSENCGMNLITDKILIRELQPDDEEAFIRMASDGTLSEIFGDCSNCGEWMGSWIDEAIGLYQGNDPLKEYLAYAIVERSTNQAVGSVGCSAYEDLGETGLTYFVGSSFRGRGIATEAARAFTAYFLKQYPAINRLIATARTGNISSCRCIEKAGYTFLEQRAYKDINDAEPQLYNFYEYRNNYCKA